MYVQCCSIYNTTGVIPISLFLLATGTVLRKAAIDRGVRLATGRYGCRQINKNIKFDGKCANLVCVPKFWCLNRFSDSLLLFK